MTSESHSWPNNGPADDDMFDVDEAALHRQTLQSMRQHGSPLLTTTAATTASTETASDSASTETASDSASTETPSDSDTENGSADAPTDAAAAATDAASADTAGHPYIKITPAREQVTPKQVVKGLFGFYRAGDGRTFPLDLDRHLPLVTPRSTFEFLIHKPAGARRFDFYVGVHPYSPTAFTNLASNLSAMYPGAFTFEVVSFSPAAAFDPEQDEYGGSAALAEREGIEDLESFTQVNLGVDRSGQVASGGPSTADVPSDGTAGTIADGPPAMARWVGVESQSDDYMTLLDRFTEVTTDSDDDYRSPLSVLLEQAVGTEAPFLYQVVWTPRPDWTAAAEKRKRNLKLGYTGTLDAFLTELVRFVRGAGEAERRQRHRPSTPEQIGGSVRAGADADASQLSRMEQIDVKQPAVTFDVSIRAAGAESVISTVTGALNSLSGPYYGLKGKQLGQDKRAFGRLCNAEIADTFRGRFGDTDPVIVASPNELANVVTVPHTAALPQASRGASGGSPDSRSPLTATDEDLLGTFDTGMHVGSAVTAPPSRENIPIRLTAEQLVQHVLRTGTTGSGKTTAMINDALTAYAAFDGPIFLFDKKGGSLCEEYKRAHFAEYGNLDDVIHLPVPGPNGEVPAFPLFDIRPQLAVGMPRETAVQEKVDRFNELLRFVVGEEAHDQAFVAQEILNSLIEALFDPVHGADAFEIRDLLEEAQEMQRQEIPPDDDDDLNIPPVSDDDLETALARHFYSDEYRFRTSIDAVLNRLTKLRERDFVWRLLNFVPDWDQDRQQYATEQRLFDLTEILGSRKVVLLDPGDLRPQSRNLFSLLMLDYIWAGVRLRQRWHADVPSPSDGYLINLIIDEAAPIMQTSLVRNEMIQDAREFALSFEVIVHFAEQVKKDELDTKAYKELLRNFNTKLVGKLGIDRELARVLFHEELDTDELFDRTTSMPRGEVIAQLPDTGFMTDTPELVTLRPLSIPAGHSDSDAPVDHGTSTSATGITFETAARQQWDQTRLSYCLIPGIRTSKSAAQRAATESGAASDADDQACTDDDTADDTSDEAASDDTAASDSVGDEPATAENNESTESAADSDGDPVAAGRSGVGTKDGNGPASAASSSNIQEGGEGEANGTDRIDVRGTRNEYGGFLGIVGPSDVEDAADSDGAGVGAVGSRDTSSDTKADDTSDDIEAVYSTGGGGSAESSTPDATRGPGSESTIDSSPGTGGETASSASTAADSIHGHNDATQTTGDAPSDSTRSETGRNDLTEDDRAFLQNVVLLLNGDLDEFDLLDSMTELRNHSGSRLNEETLIEEGYLEQYRIRGKKYYWVTDKGQDVVQQSVEAGPNQGDLYEKVRHKVFTAYFARYLEVQKELHVEKYYSPRGGDMVFDVAGFSAMEDGTEKLTVIGEVITRVRHEQILKHYNDFRQFGLARKFWIVRNTEVAHDLLRVLDDGGHIESIPNRSIHNYKDITQKAFGNTDTWLIIGAGKIIERVEDVS